MPRSSAQPEVETDVFDKLDRYNGREIAYPTTLKTLFSVRNAVYKYNKENGKNFRCVLDDDAVRISEKPKKPEYGKALREIEAVFKTMHEDGALNIDDLVARVENIVRTHFDGDVQEEEPAPPPPPPAQAVTRGIVRKGRR